MMAEQKPLHTKMNEVEKEIILYAYDQHNDVTDSSREKVIVKALLYNLWKYGSMHYLALLKCTTVNTNVDFGMHKYFKLMSTSEKLTFFKNRPKSFIVKNNGYVMMSAAVIQRFREYKQKEEEEVVEYLISILKEHFGEMLRKNLLRCLRESHLNISNYFYFFSINAIEEFFNEHSSHFVVLDNNYISLRVKKDKKEVEATDFLSQATQRDSQVTEIKFIPKHMKLCDDKFPSAHSLRKKSFSKTTVQSLISTLFEYGPMHYLALIKCANGKPNSQCLKEMSSPEKFAIFKQHSNVFNITDDGYVTPISSALKSHEVIVDYFVSILKANGTMLLRRLVDRLQDSDLDVEDHFKFYTHQNILKFIERYPQFTVQNSKFISLSGDLKANASEMNMKFISPASAFESVPVTGVGDTGSAVHNHPNSSMNKISPSKRQKMSTSYEKEYSAESSTALSSHSQDSVEIVETKDDEEAEFSITDAHLQSIRYFMIILKERTSIHCQELVCKACSYDRYTSVFFSHFAPEDILEFIRMHSMYFSVKDDGIVMLVNPDIAPSEVFAYEADVHQVTSIIENKAIVFFLNILCQKEKVTLSELEQHLGSAPGYIISFFVANYYGAEFPKFFQQRSNYFSIHADGYVEFKSKLPGRQLSNDASACPL